jgi:putative spermidine/putrescine transport system ATP-binding protein
MSQQNQQNQQKDQQVKNGEKEQGPHAFPWLAPVVRAPQAVFREEPQALHVEGLSRAFGNIRVSGSFKVAPGERLALLGPSGSGKTSLLRMIAGLDRVDAGRVRWGATDWTAVAVEKRRIGYVFQEYALLEAVNVLENVAFGLRMRGVAPRDREERAYAWLRRVGLADRAKARVATLSGGEKQRVALARTWVSEPRVVLLDEPFSAMDTELRGKLRQELLALLLEVPVPVVFVTHDEADCAALATRLLRVHERPAPGGISERIFSD